MTAAVLRSRMTENSLEIVVAVPVGGPGSSNSVGEPDSGELNTQSLLSSACSGTPTRTNDPYNRTEKEVTRNIVERITL